MGKTLREIAKQLIADKIKVKKSSPLKVTVQIIYAFNGTGKTRLSREFKELVAPKKDINEEDTDLSKKKIIYYNAFTEDLFYWDNDLENDVNMKLKIHPNAFTKWIFADQGQDQNVISYFQHCTNSKLSPHFNEEYTLKDNDGVAIPVPAFSEVTFSYERGNDEASDNIKISKGEESCFVWSIFYSLLTEVVNVLNVLEPSERETDQFDQLEYIFIDDPVSSLDENNLIELAVNLAKTIKASKSALKFVITTHNPLFYNVLHNEFNSKIGKKYFLKKDASGQFDLTPQGSDSPFSYHLYLIAEIEEAIEAGLLKKYHFNFLRNILEKTTTFLGYEKWGDLLPKTDDGGPNPYETRIINISSHSKHSAEESIEITDRDKSVLSYVLKHIKENYKFKG